MKINPENGNGDTSVYLTILSEELLDFDDIQKQSVSFTVSLQLIFGSHFFVHFEMDHNKVISFVASYSDCSD